MCKKKIFYEFLITDGKFHVVPSGDLHIMRADLSDGSAPYVCRVKNILTGLEETSPAFQLTVQEGKIKNSERVFEI